MSTFLKGFHILNSPAAALVAFALFSLTASGSSIAAQGLSLISPEQSVSIEKSLQMKGANHKLNTAVLEAAPNIASFLKINSCLSGNNASSLNIFAAPGKSYPDNNYSGPLSNMYRHDKSICATVLRVQGWTMPANNALRFEVVYVADDSGEAGKSEHEVQKQSSGEWLFSR